MLGESKPDGPQLKVIKDWEWANKYIDQIKQILKANALHLIDVIIAEYEKDAMQATDLIVKITGGDVAVRIRRYTCTHRDLTIRARRDSGFKTEIDKIRDEFADWYLYCWTNILGQINEYILVDLNKARVEGIFDNDRKLISNRDGTYFYAYSTKELFAIDAIVSFELL